MTGDDVKRAREQLGMGRLEFARALGHGRTSTATAKRELRRLEAMPEVPANIDRRVRALLNKEFRRLSMEG